MSSNRAFVLAAALAAVCACSSSDSGTIPFHGEAELLSSFEWDSAFVPSGSPAQVRVAVRGGGGATIDARGAASGDVLTPVVGSGALAASGSLTLAVHAKVDVGSVHYEGLVQEVGYTLPSQSTSFDPFLLDGARASLDSVLPPGPLLSAPIPSVPGSTLVLAIEGGTVTTTVAGTCARARDGYAHYLAHATVSGTVDLSATIEIEVPLRGTQSFGPFAIQVPIPPIERDVDLGLFDVASRTRVESGPSPCSGGVGDGGTVADGGTGGGDGGVGPGTDGSVVAIDGGGHRVCAEPVAPPVGQACDYGTYECLALATTPDEADACFAADAAPDLCWTCVVQELQSCASCDDEHQVVRCCAEDRGCAGLDEGPFQSCVDAFCPAERDAYIGCISSPPCETTDLCFRAPR